MGNQPVDLDVALAHHQRGAIDQAAALYEALLAQDSNHPDALHLLGLIRLLRGQSEQALNLIEQAIKVQPDNPVFHASLGEVYWALGRPLLTVACYREALRLQPDSPDVLSNMGATLLHLGEVDEAIMHLKAALSLQPESAAVHNNLGNAFRTKGELSATLNAYTRASALLPTSPEIQSNLGKTLLELGDANEALKHCQSAVRLQPGFAVGWVNLGNVMRALGRFDESVACFREAIRLQPNLPNAHAGLGNVLEDLGETEQAMTAYHDTLRLDPRNAGVLGRLATRLGDRLSPAHQKLIEQSLDNPSLSREDRLPLLFGLAHTLDARGKFDRAAQLTREANALRLADFRARGRPYNPATHHAFVADIISTFTAEFFARTAGFGLETPRPVFIVGLPRSGTTLAEQILASHPRVFAGGELRLMQTTFESLPAAMDPTLPTLKCLPLLDQKTIRKLAKNHLDALAAIDAQTDRFVDKMPENTVYLGLIATLFPRSTIIHCRRDIRDVATSCWLTDFAHLNWTCELDHIASRVHEYLQLMNHWRLILPVPIFEFDYETFVNDPEPTTRALIAHCGLEWDERCLEFHKTSRAIQTASVAQVRQPVYRRSVGRWRNYETPLADLFAKLTPGSF